MLPDDVPRWAPRLAAIAAFGFGAMVNTATAAHWHDVSDWANQWHGLVHGSSTTDRHYESQVESNNYYIDAEKQCAVGNYDVSATNRIRGSYVGGPGGVCRAVVYSTEGYNEQRGWSRVFAEVTDYQRRWVSIPTHYHNAH
jgi:hypothetical protein